MLDITDFPSTLALISFVGLFGYIYRTRSHPSYLPPSPPGPKPLPLLGNLLSLPSAKPWETYASWSRENKSKPFGDLISVRTFGQLSVIVNTLEAAKELLERRSAVYSDRPLIPMIEMMEWDFNLGLMPYSDKWRRGRKVFHQHFHARVAVVYQPLQEECARALLKLLLEKPKDFLAHLRIYAAKIAMTIAYAHDVEPSGDRYIDIAERSVAMVSNSVFPGAVLVNVFPFLRNLPDWFPGTYFKTYAKRCAALTREMRDKPFEAVKACMVDGAARPSLTMTLLEENEARGGGEAGEDVIKDVAALTYLAGEDTTVSALTTVILALVLHPSVQRRAQAELDRVVGRACLPTFEQREALPYVGAVCRETLRWIPVTPLGVTHSAYQDDIYKGWGVPKGTHIIINAWAMLHNPEEYEDPESFKPERFLNEDGTLNNDEVQPAFGFGRRICPGRHLASATLWIMVASILAVYDIEKAQDDTGTDIPVSVDCTDGVVRYGSVILDFIDSVRSVLTWFLL
ncbi:hypothetical protein EW146_g6132 [Bondarzewia mesenterica]|uniref:Cytochrome P450 n=1 Tax=Bondarzewia mesenterica TaxID=1095465 RepID=A0A4S4LRB5_9AGAM|nr:hypothetical protein EW146_g6132 [Bondarzewia mesenterica]